MSYYKKLLATNIIVSTAYILFFSFIISTISFFAEKRVYENNMIEYMNKFSVEINRSISNAQTIANILSNNEYVQDYAVETAPDYINRKKVSGLLADEIDMLLTHGSQICITKYYDDHIITSFYTSNFDFFGDHTGITKENMEQIINSFDEKQFHNVAYLFTQSAKDSFFNVIVRKTVNLSNPYYVLISYPVNILFDTAQYRDVLIPAASTGNRLVYIGDDSLAGPISDYIASGKKHGYKIFSFTPDTPINPSDLTYHFIIHNRNYIWKFIPNILLAFLLFIPLFVFGILLMRRITNSIYQPVKGLINALPNSERASTENEFDFVISEFNKLESDNNANSKIINTFKISAKEKFIKDLLFGTLSNRDIMRYTEEYHLPEITNEVTVIIIEYNDYNDLISNLSRSGMFNMKTAVASLLYSVFGDNTPFIITETSPNNHVLITDFDDINKTRVLLQTTLLQLMEDMNVDISASIGRPVDSYINLCDSYYSAIEIARHQSINFEHKVVATSADIKSDNDNRIIYLPQVESGLISAVLSCSFDRVHSLLQEIFRESHVSSNDGFAQLVIMLYSTEQKILYNVNLSEKDVFGKDTSIYLDLRGCQSISSLKSVFTSQLNSLMNYISLKQSEKITERSDEMKNFIAQHYTEDISLLNLAEYMNMSQEHTSRIFKIETGTNFKEYLMHLRYEKAMEILAENPNMKLKDVALSVGCSNAKNLSRLINRYKN